MAFNPTLPVDGSLMVAGEMRDQFNALAAQITEQGELMAAQDMMLAALDARISALEGAFGGTARNPSSVATLSESISNPATGPQVQAILDVLNQLITAVKRS